jgi:hypothetical protein
MCAFACHRPVYTLRDRHSLVIGVVEERRFTGKIIACGAYGDAQGDILAADAVSP